MRTIIQIIFVSFIVFPVISQEKTRTGEVHFNDSTNIYYFDLFNDKRSFHWDTISKVFNFGNYRIYFKNNSSDTLLTGRITTGDGRVTYHYAGNHKLILPGEYYVIKPFHNGSLHYRIGRFSKNVSISLMKVSPNGDSTIHFSHRFVGWYSNVDSSSYSPRIKLDEPLNTYPTGYEVRFLQGFYEKRMQEYETRKNNRRKKESIAVDTIRKPIVAVEQKSSEATKQTVAEIKPKKIQGELHLYLRYRRHRLDSTERVYAESDNGDRELKRIMKYGYRPYYLLTNPDSLEKIMLYTKNAQGRKRLHQKVETTHWRDVDMDFDGYWAYYSKVDSSKVFTREHLSSIRSSKIKTKFWISIHLENEITAQCEMEVLEQGKWEKIPLKEATHLKWRFQYLTLLDSYRRKIRWKITSDKQWNTDWIYLYRSTGQSITVDSLVNSFKINGKYHLDFDPLYYRMNVVDNLHNWSSKNEFIDSVKEVMRWYGIPILSADFNTIKLKNQQDNIRAQRALNRHFGKVILLPTFDGYNKLDWLANNVRVEFLKNVSEKEISLLLKRLGFSDFNIYKNVYEDSEGLLVQIVFKDVLSPSFLRRLKLLYVQKEIKSLSCVKLSEHEPERPYE